MIWKLEDQFATFAVDGFTGKLDLHSPSMGLSLQGLWSAQPISPLLGVSFADSHRVRLQDCYQRIDDLIAIYPQTSHRPFNVQLQYRVFAGGELDSTLPVLAHQGVEQPSLVIEQWISNFTFTLDSHPQLDVELFPVYHDSVNAIQVWQDIDGQLVPLATAEADGANIAIVVAQPTAAHPAMAVMVHPLDQGDSDFSIRGSDEPEVTGVAMLRLFDRFMEKGVIRRARLRLLVSSEMLSDELLFEHYQWFAASPLPLTT